MTQAETRTAESVDELRRSLEGDAVVPGDVQYDAARTLLQRARRPAARGDRALPRTRRTSRPPSTSRARNELEVAVRGGGHNPAGHCVLRRRAGDRPLAHAARARGPRRARSLARKVARRGSTSTLRRQADGLVTPGGVVGSTGVLRPRARRRHRSPDVAARSDVRQHRRRPTRDSRRHRGARTTRRESGAPLGATGRWGQLRRRHAPRASPPSAGARRRRPARVSRQRGRRCTSHLPRRRRALA